MSKLFGAKKLGEMKTAVYTSCISTAVVCAITMIIGLSCSTPLLRLINTPDSVFADSKLYLDIYVWGLPFVFFYNISTGIFSAMGDSKTPFVFLACSSLANIGMDILFVAVFNMGVGGVAWATFICQGISCILAVSVVFARLTKIKTEGRVKAFSAKILRDTAVIAIPSMLQQSLISVGNMMIQSIVNSFDTAVMAGYSASIKLNNLVVTSFATLGNGVSNYTSQNLGAGKTERIRPGFMSGIAMVWIISIPIVLLYMLLSKPLLLIFLEDNDTSQAIACGIEFLRIVSPFYFVISIKTISDGVLRGAGKMGRFTFSTFTDLVLRVGIAELLYQPLGTKGIWWAWPIGWAVGTIISVTFYFTSKWRRPLPDEPYMREAYDNSTAVSQGEGLA